MTEAKVVAGDMLFATLDPTLRAIDPKDLDIYWGAYLGTEDEVLVSGRLSERIDEIAIQHRVMFDHREHTRVTK